MVNLNTLVSVYNLFKRHKFLRTRYHTKTIETTTAHIFESLQVAQRGIMQVWFA